MTVPFLSSCRPFGQSRLSTSTRPRNPSPRRIPPISLFSTHILERTPFAMRGSTSPNSFLSPWRTGDLTTTSNASAVHGWNASDLDG